MRPIPLAYARGSVVCLLLMAMPAVAGSLDGRVTNSVTGAGIGGANVNAWMIRGGSIQNGSMREARTDDTGAFRMEGVPDGEYTLSCSRAGFTLKRVGTGQGPEVQVSGAARVDCQMTPFATLRGRVLDPEGNPLAGITVFLRPALANFAVTDENGVFIFEKLPAGSYKLVANPKAGAAEKDGRRMVMTDFPSGMNSDQGVAIKVDGMDVAGYEIRMQTAVARRVRGKVIGANGKPVAKVDVAISKRGSGRAVVLNGRVYDIEPSQPTGERVQTGDDGVFEFPALVEGEWLLRANLIEYDYEQHRNTAQSGAAEVRVGDDDIENVEIRMARPLEVEASADWGDSPPPSRGSVLPNLFALDGQVGGSADPPERGKPAHLHPSAGRYLVTGGVLPIAGYYLAAMIMDNRDVMGQVIELTGPTALKMIYKKGGGSVHGEVEGGAGATVVVMTDERNGVRMGWSARCGPDGTFTIANVPPGEYTIAAFRNSNDLGGPAFSGVLASRGDRVKIEDGAVAQVNLRVN